MKEINSNGFNMADDMRKVRVEERLKIKIGEAKNLPARSHGGACHRDIYCVLSLDQEEIFRTSTMERTLNPFFGEEFQFEVPRRFRYLSIYVFDRDKHLKQDRVLGKVAIKQEDLHGYNNKDHWFALRPVDADSEVQGKAYIELSLEDSRKRLRMEPKPPDPDPNSDSCSSKANRGKNLGRLSEYCKESMRFGSCSSSTSKKLLSAVATEPAMSLSRSESLKDRAQWAVRAKPPMHAMSESDTSPSPTAADYWSDPERHCAARVGPDTIRLRVLECSELTTKNGQCDPYALVTIVYSNGRRVERRTKAKKKTVNPQFDEIFCFDLVLEADPKDKDGSQSAGVASEARVSVWHEAATPVFLGEVRLQLRQPAPAPRAWFFLSARAGGAASRGATPPGTRLSAAGGAALGSLRLLLQYTVDHVFPIHHYRRLEELFLMSVTQKPITSSAVYILGEIVASKTDAAQPLVRLFTHHDLIVPVVRELADAEISVLTDATTIFRGNTLVSKMMDEAMRLSGAAYLRSVLRPTLAAVLADRRPCEIDPARVKPAAAVQPNLANLNHYVQRVFDSITSSYAMCPAVMCRLFDALRQSAARHFPHNAEVRYSVVSGFIFLRFFAPAILGPRLFDLTTEQIDPQTNRTLTLISKTIQSLGNLVSSRSAQQVCKEEYMAELYRSFCTPRHVQAIKQFLEIISTSSDTQSSSVQESPVLLKEGTMIKRSEGARGGVGSPRRRWARAAQAHAKRRHFRLTSGELTWSRCGAKAAAHRLPLAGVLAVAPVDCPPAGAPLGANNIFQIVHRERVLFVQASNCVERAEWVRLLTALCRHSPAAPPHKGYYADTEWTCCGKREADAEGCGGCEGTAAGDRETLRGPAALALRLDPARDLQRLHALLVAHAAPLDARALALQADGANSEDRETELATLRELQEAMFDLEHRHRVYHRSLARETKYGSKQAPIGDDNYLHLAGAGSGMTGMGGGESGAFLWRTWRPEPGAGAESAAPAASQHVSVDVTSSTESLKMARHLDERSSGKSNKSTGSGYLTMSCLKQEPSEDSDHSGGRPARPPKPARLSPSRATLTPLAGDWPTLSEYVDVELKPPERRPKSDASPPKRHEADPSYRCKEYELMANFMSHAASPSSEEAPPAVPPRGHTAQRARLHPKPERAPAAPRRGSAGSLPDAEPEPDDPADQRPASKLDTLSNDDSLLDELQRDTYCVLKVCEDESGNDSSEINVEEPDRKEKEDYGIFSRISIQRKSNPIKAQSNPMKPLKTSSSTSNVHDTGTNSSRPLAERLTPFFLKKKSKPPEDPQATNKSSQKEENFFGRLTPRFGQSRLYGRGQSLELAPPETRTKRIERSATTVNLPTRPINSSIVANLKFLSLHRYGAQEDVQCRTFVRNSEPEAGVAGSAARGEAPAGGGAGPAGAAAAGADAAPTPAPEALEFADAAWRSAAHAHGSLVAAASSDIRL